MSTIELHVNKKSYGIKSVGSRLSSVLREEIGLRGTKVGCDAGDCGACTVIVDDKAVCACLMPALQAEGCQITTVEGLGEETLNSLQKAFLRHGAAQCGICTPGMLMAASALLMRESEPSKQDVEEALSGVLCRCTGYQKIVQAVCDAVENSPPAERPPAGGAVGAPIERLDGRPKVTGTDLFGADDWPEGALIVTVVRSPHNRAAFHFGDLDAWGIGQPGVVAVLTAKDIDGSNCFGVIPPFADQPALAVTEAKFRGEAVAIVAYEADAGPPDLSRFPLEWSALPANIDLQKSRSVELVHESRPENILVRGMVRTGDAEAALVKAAHVVEGEFETAYVEHAYIEPEAGSAWMDGKTLVIRAATQAPIMDRDDTAAVLGLEKEEVRIIPSACGGGFGSKLDVSIQPLLGLVTLKTGRPCRICYDRSQSMMSTTKRHPSKMRGSIGADTNGRITAMSFQGDFNTGAYASWGPTVANRVPVHASGPYYTPNYHAEARALHTNGPVSGAFRGFGVPQATILQEMLYDDLCHAGGFDRLEFRIKNALQDGQKSVCGQELYGVGIKDCLEALRGTWKKMQEEADIANEEGGPIRFGVGLGSCWYGCGNTALPNPSTIRLGLTTEGRLLLHQGAMDVGQGANTVVTQICSDALGIAVDAFELVGPDTGLTPDCGKTSASRQTYITGKAAEAAGKSLRDKILRLTNAGACAQLQLEGDHLTIVDGTEETTIVLSQMEQAGYGFVLWAEETYDPPTTALDDNGQGTPYAVYGYGAQIALVAVDTLLGTVKVNKVVAAHDLGRVINPVLAEGQIEGGIAQGLGMALMEEYIPGRTENLHDYLIPTVGDMPEITSLFIEKPDPEGPMGAKGLGEHVLIPTAPAILGAIRDAAGHGLRNYRHCRIGCCAPLRAQGQRRLFLAKAGGWAHER